MDDLATRGIRSNAACFAALSAGSPGARRLSQAGLLTLATPAAPERPLFNTAFALAPGAIDGAYDELDRFYRDAGIHGWTVFVDPGDEASAAVLEGQGHVLDGEPRLRVPRRPTSRVGWSPASSWCGAPAPTSSPR